jgi:hypothetical protein
MEYSDIRLNALWGAGVKGLTLKETLWSISRSRGCR